MVSALIDGNRRPTCDDVCFDFSALSFMEGDGLTVFANTIEWLCKRGVKCGFISHNLGSNALRYLDDCGFFKIYLGYPLSQTASVRDTTLPLRKVQHRDSHAWLEHDFTPWLAHKLGTTPASLATARTCIKEVFNNIIEHSSEDTGCIHTQWYPNINRLRIAIADFGLGIPTVIRTKYFGLLDSQAIYEATKEGTTTKSYAGNAGAGLSYLIDYVVGTNGGKVEIRSGCGAVQCHEANRRILKNHWSVNGFYPGTVLQLTLRTDRIEYLDADEREELTW